MQTLNDLNRQLAGLGRLKSVLILEFSAQWQWLALSLMLIGYVLSPSVYFDMHLMSMGRWTLVALATLLFIGSGGGLFLLLVLRKTHPLVARWCCLVGLCPLWMPSLFIIEGLPTLIFLGLVMGLCFMSCSLACTLAPATTMQPIHDK